MYIYIYVDVCMYIYIYMYIYTRLPLSLGDLPGTLALSAFDLLAFYPQFSATSEFLSLGHHWQGTKVRIWP